MNGSQSKAPTDVEAAGLEFGMVQQRAAEVAHPDQRGAPFAVDAKGSFDGGDEAGYIVAYATHAEFAKIGEVLCALGMRSRRMLQQAGRRR